MIVLGLLIVSIVVLDAYGMDVIACLEEVKREQGAFASMLEALHIMRGEL
jgi:hypothetical protein